METGFPSPAQGYEGKPLDLNALFVRKPSSTYFMRMRGRALELVGIRDGDLLIADRSLAPKPESVVIAEYGGEFVCRVLKKAIGGAYRLTGSGVPPIDVDEGVSIVAVVPFSVRRLP